MRHQFISEEQFKVIQQRASRVGVKEHTATTGRGRGAVSDRRNGTMVKSSARTLRATNPYSSKWEAAYANKLELEKRAGLIKWWRYEPFSLWLPGKVRYKPDFLVHYHPTTLVETSPMLEVIEVKGWSKNRRDGVTRLKIAAALFPCFTWRLVQWNGSGFVGEYIT